MSDEDDLTLPDLARVRTVILNYDPRTDSVVIDANGCSPLEVRGIVSMAQDDLDLTPYPDFVDDEETE